MAIFVINVEGCDSSIEEYGDFVHIWCTYQVPCIAHACKIMFCSVPNVSNYSLSYNWFCDILENNGLMLFVFGGVSSCLANVCKIAFGSMPRSSNYGIICDTFLCLCSNIADKRVLILFRFSTATNHTSDLVHVKYLCYVPTCSIYVHYYINVVCL